MPDGRSLRAPRVVRLAVARAPDRPRAPGAAADSTGGPSRTMAAAAPRETDRRLSPTHLARTADRNACTTLARKFAPRRLRITEPVLDQRSTASTYGAT